MNANDIIKTSLTLCGVLAGGETPNPNDATLTYEALNRMLDSWKAQRLTCYQVTRETFALPMTATVTIGPTGTWVVSTAPVWIQDASTIQNYGVAETEFEMPLRVYTPQEWARAITMKTMTNTLPIGIYYERGAPNGTINIWPTLTVSDLYIALYLAVPISLFTSRVAQVYFPPGYEEAVTYQLAKRIAPMFGRTLDPLVLEIADTSVAIVKASNENMDVLTVDTALTPSGTGTWNYLTGEYMTYGGGN